MLLNNFLMRYRPAFDTADPPNNTPPADPPEDDDDDLPPEPPVRRSDGPELPSKSQLIRDHLRDYRREMRDETQQHREKAKEERKKRIAAEAAVVAAKDQATRDIEAAKVAAAIDGEKRAEAKANERIIRAEVKTLAVKAGMVDLDGLKLADLSTVTVEGDDVKGAEEVITKLKEAKPYLFGEPPTGTSDTSQPPKPPGNDKPKLATAMSKDEYNASKKALLKA